MAVGSVNLYGTGPDAGIDQSQILRAQQLAQLLQQQANAPIESPAPNAPMSWTQGAAKLAEGLAARKQNQKVSALQKDAVAKQQALIQSLFPQQPMAATPLGDALAPGAGVMQSTATPGAQRPGLPSLTGSREADMALASQPGGLPAYLQSVAAQRAKAQEDATKPMVVPEGGSVWQGGNLAYRGTPKPTKDTLHSIIGPDGKPILATTENAEGKTPYTPSILASNAPLLSSDDPQVASFKSQILAGNMNLANVPMNLRGSVAQALNDKTQFAPTAASKFTMAASRITHPYTNMSAYKLTADGKPYLERIDAAMKNPGSVGDQDLLDSLTKLNTGGNAVTEAQVGLITHGQSYSDMANTFLNKFKNGGVLSPDQRQQLHDIAYQIYDNYKKGYQPIYEKAASQLTEAGIPKAFWTIPDLNALNSEPSSDQTGKRLSPEEASKLPSGTKFVGQDGVERVRH